MKDKKKKYSLPFVNKGKPFELNDWNVYKHNRVLKIVAEYEEKHPKATDKEKDEYYQDILILYGLKEIDDSITIDDLNTMHPIDRTAMFAAIYYTGRKGILYQEKSDDENFRKSKAKETK